MKNRILIVTTLLALIFCLCLSYGFICFKQNVAITVAAATPQIALEIVEIKHDSVAVSGTITNIGAVDRTGFEYRLISGSEILWQAKDVEPPALSFSTTIEELQSSSNYAVRAFYTVGLAIYYSDVQDFSTPEAPADPTVTPTTTPGPTLTPAPTTAPTTQTTQTTTSRETTEATSAQTTTQSQFMTTTTATDADNPGSSESTSVFLLVILSIIALALISIAVALFINIAKKSKQGF